MGGHGLKTLVLISGAISALVWLAPSLVTIGFFMLIIPGMILAIMPTVFVYLLAALLIRMILPFSGPPATLAALAIAVAIGFILPEPWRLMQTAQYRSAMKPDVLPAEPIRLAGEVLVVRQRDARSSVADVRCEALCAALLATPGVTGVTWRETWLGRDDIRQRHFRLDPAAAGKADGKGPLRPEDIVMHLPEINAPHQKGEKLTARSERRQEIEQAVKSDWTIRLATQAAIVEAPEGPAPAWTISIIDDVGGGWKPRTSRVELAAGQGDPVLRSSLVSQKLLARPFHFGFEGGIDNARFVVAHTRLANAPAYPDFAAQQVLLRHTSLIDAIPDAGQSAALRAAVVAAIDDPAASSARLDLARGWMDSLPYQPAPDDRALAHRVIAEQRITGIDKQVRRFYAKSAPAELRDSLAARIVNPASSEQERRTYGFLLSKLPPGAFAELRPNEARILTDPALRRQAAPFIERLADQGQPGLIQLMRILEDEIASDAQWAVQRPVIRAVRRGLARMGPAAASALPRIRELFGRTRNPLANLWQEGTEWRVAMARMGQPIDDLFWLPDRKPESLERDKAQIRKRLANFDPAWESGYSY